MNMKENQEGIHRQFRKCSVLTDTESHYSGSSDKSGVKSITDKQITFIEALLAKKLGLRVYGITEVGSIKEWNPENQNIVSWYAIENGKWFIRGDKNG